MAKNTAPLCSGDYIPRRWLDVVQPKPVDARSGSEIAADVIKRAGLVVKKSEPV